LIKESVIVTLLIISALFTYFQLSFSYVLKHLPIEGPVQTSCFCRAELNSGIKLDESTAEARRLNQTFELSSASN